MKERPKKPRTKKQPPKAGEVPSNEGNSADHGILEDQRKRGYYYDDAYGYENYVPGALDEDQITDPEKSA